jgi:hypothetical protein
VRVSSESEPRNYSCPRLGKVVVVSYLFEPKSVDRGAPRGVHCAGARECGVEQAGQGQERTYDWTPCPLYPELVREGFLPA